MIRFEPFTESEFPEYWNYVIETWMTDMKRAGLSDESVGHKEAEEQIRRFIPRGMDTPGHYFMHVSDDGEKVGTVWLEIRNRGSMEAFIWDIVINSEHRGKGLGKEALKLTETFAMEKGAVKMSLNVFSYNEVAINLYRKSGFRDAATTMVKVLKKE